MGETVGALAKVRAHLFVVRTKVFTTNNQRDLVLF